MDSKLISLVAEQVRIELTCEDRAFYQKHGLNYLGYAPKTEIEALITKAIKKVVAVNKP